MLLPRLLLLLLMLSAFDLLLSWLNGCLQGDEDEYFLFLLLLFVVLLLLPPPVLLPVVLIDVLLLLLIVCLSQVIGLGTAAGAGAVTVALAGADAGFITGGGLRACLFNFVMNPESFPQLLQYLLLRLSAAIHEPHI